MCEGADSPGTSWLSRRGMWCHIGTWTDDVVFMFVPENVVNIIQCIYVEISKSWRRSTMEA